MTIFLLVLLAQIAPLSRDQEQRILQEAVSQVGNSPVDFIRATERHLRKYPQSSLRDDLERAIARAAVDAKDLPRTIRYGEKVLTKSEDTSLLESVARALVSSDDPQTARKALGYAQRLEKFGKDDGEQVIARAQVLQARSLGNLGETDKAIAKALQSYQTYPTGEAAREAARWEVRAGRKAQCTDCLPVSGSRRRGYALRGRKVSQGSLFLRAPRSQALSKLAAQCHGHRHRVTHRAPRQVAHRVGESSLQRHHRLPAGAHRGGGR